MSPRRLIVFTGVFLALLAGAGYETRTALQRDEQLAALRRRAAQLLAESAALRREHDATAQDLAEAERQFATLPPLSADAAAVTPERRSEMNAWLSRMKQLRRLFADRADQRIPEMQFLTDQDWLRVAKMIDLDSEEGRRKALAAARDQAVSRFLPQLTSALRKLSDSKPSEMPTAIFALAPFATPPIDAQLLERYELLKTTETQPQWKVQVKAPIDPDYDSRHYTSVYVDFRGYGSGSEGAPWAWVPDFRDQSSRAYRAFAEANKGASASGLADVLPYFNPPLAPALAEKLVKAERERQR